MACKSCRGSGESCGCNEECCPACCDCCAVAQSYLCAMCETDEAIDPFSERYFCESCEEELGNQ